MTRVNRHDLLFLLGAVHLFLPGTAYLIRSGWATVSSFHFLEIYYAIPRASMTAYSSHFGIAGEIFFIVVGIIWIFNLTNIMWGL